MLCVIMLRVIMPSVIMLSVIMLSVIMLSIIMLSVIILSVMIYLLQCWISSCWVSWRQFRYLWVVNVALEDIFANKNCPCKRSLNGQFQQCLLNLPGVSPAHVHTLSEIKQKRQKVFISRSNVSIYSQNIAKNQLYLFIRMSHFILLYHKKRLVVLNKSSYYWRSFCTAHEHYNYIQLDN